MGKPTKENYGYVESTGFDSEPSGFVIEGGEEAYEEALSLWIRDNKTNIANEEYYEVLKQDHIHDGGKHPEEYALTELIKKAIIDKTYKHYSGGGYEYRTENIIKNYDVVVWFNYGDDAYFQVCLDNSEGDSCVLWSSNAKCEILKKIM